jgi:hypothetical protein
MERLACGRMPPNKHQPEYLTMNKYPQNKKAKQIFASNGFKITKGPRKGPRHTVNEWQINLDGSLELIGSRTASKRELGRCYRNLARNGGWL